MITLVHHVTLDSTKRTLLNVYRVSSGMIIDELARRMCLVT